MIIDSSKNNDRAKATPYNLTYLFQRFVGQNSKCRMNFFVMDITYSNNYQNNSFRDRFQRWRRLIQLDSLLRSYTFEQEIIATPPLPQ